MREFTIIFDEKANGFSAFVCNASSVEEAIATMRSRPEYRNAKIVKVDGSGGRA